MTLAEVESELDEWSAKLSSANDRCYQMIETKKKFDAVAMMRSARDRISTEIEGMSLEEALKWLASQKIDDPFLKRLRDRAAQHADSADRPPAGRWSARRWGDRR